jgi:hypothetical protein
MSSSISELDTTLPACFWKMHRKLRETGTLMTPARAGLGRWNVWDQEEVLGYRTVYGVHDNQSANTRHISCRIGRISQRAAWRTVRENNLYPFPVQPVQGLQQGNNISVYSFLDGRYARLCTQEIFSCPVVVHD